MFSKNMKNRIVDGQAVLYRLEECMNIFTKEG